jgi:hypothetical protein
MYRFRVRTLMASLQLAVALKATNAAAEGSALPSPGRTEGGTSDTKETTSAPMPSAPPIVLVVAGGASIFVGTIITFLPQSAPLGLAVFGSGAAAVGGGIVMILGAKTSVSQSVGGRASVPAPVAKARLDADVRHEQMRPPPSYGVPIFTVRF